MISRCDSAYKIGNENNQLSVSPLASVTDLRCNFPPEFMHSVCLGVVRKMCSYFFTHVKGFRLPCRMSVYQKEIINEKILHLRKYIPSEFNRKIRTLKEFENFKAVEFRSIILYFGPILFHNVLPLNFLNNFMLLHFAMYSFASELYCVKCFDNASSCRELFCKDAEMLHQKKLMTRATRKLPGSKM